MPKFTVVAHVDLSVSNLERSAAWYSEVLGLKRLREADKGSYDTVILRHEETGLIVGLNQHHTVPVDRFDERNVGLDHIGFGVTDRAELDVWETRLTELGVEHSPVTDSPTGSGTALVFRDPDNVQLEFWWTRPR